MRSRNTLLVPSFVRVARSCARIEPTPYDILCQSTDRNSADAFLGTPSLLQSCPFFSQKGVKFEITGTSPTLLLPLPLLGSCFLSLLLNVVTVSTWLSYELDLLFLTIMLTSLLKEKEKLLRGVAAQKYEAIVLNGFPPMLNPRKSNPSLMCVTVVFSAASTRPRSRRNASTAGFTLSANTS
jgi:heme exporter protein D